MNILNRNNPPVRFSRIILFFMISSFFLFFFSSLSKVYVFSFDFWWHLANGKYIVEHRSLPEKDPFTYTSHDTPSEDKSVEKRKAAILKGNWLAQVILYTVYNLFNLKGIIILRALLLTLYLLFTFLTIRKQNTPYILALILVSVVFLRAGEFGSERPQLFTFFIFSLTFYLLEDFRLNRARKVFLVPILVLLLSNMHPGYIVCILLVFVYLAGEGIRVLFSRDFRDSGLKQMFMVSILTVLFSMLNPNGASMLTSIFFVHGSWFTYGIAEFIPTFFLYEHKLATPHSSYLSFLVLSFLSLRYIKRLGVTHLLLLIIFAVMSFVALRYTAFYMCIAAPIIASAMKNLKDEKIFRGITGYMKKGEIFLNLVACIIGISLIFNSIPSLARFKFKENTFSFFPRGAANFLKDVDIKGNMFNEYGFGGYLVWRLNPEKKVFIDGRALEKDVFKDYREIVSLTGSWEEKLKKYNITYIIVPPLYHLGGIPPLVEQLFISDDWTLIYLDHLAMIFLMNNSGNDQIAEEYEIEKKTGLHTIIVQASAHAIKNKVNPFFPLAIGKGFFMMGEYEKAEKALQMAKERDPDHPVVNFWLQKLKETRKDGNTSTD